MSRKKRHVRKPTAGELELLGVLWRQPNSTVREVHEILNAQRPTGYTTVLKMLQIMAEKGLVVRTEAERAHRYSAGVDELVVQKGLLLDLADRLFSGSSATLAMRALSARPPSDDEIDEIRALIERRRGKE